MTNEEKKALRKEVMDRIVQNAKYMHFELTGVLPHSKSPVAAACIDVAFKMSQPSLYYEKDEADEYAEIMRLSRRYLQKKLGVIESTAVGWQENKQ